MYETKYNNILFNSNNFKENMCYWIKHMKKYNIKSFHSNN